TPNHAYFVIPVPDAQGRVFTFKLAATGADAAAGNALDIGGPAATQVQLAVALPDPRPVTLDGTAHTLTFGSEDDVEYQTGDPLVYRGTADGTAIAGLTPGQTYYVIVDDAGNFVDPGDPGNRSSVIRFAATFDDAQNGNAIAITAAE